MVNASNELLFPEGITPFDRPTLDARTAGLLRLKLYFSLLRFFRAGDRGGPPEEFRVPIANILEEWPDAEKDLKLPAISFIAAPGLHTAIALGGPVLCEDSVGIFGPNTALEQTALYQEQFVIETWASVKSERRALVAGLQLAMWSSPDSYAIRMKLPDYYRQIATYVLDETLYVDDIDVIKGRRRAQLKVTMTIPEVRLVHYPSLRVIVGVEVNDRGFCDSEVVIETEV